MTADRVEATPTYWVRLGRAGPDLSSVPPTIGPGLLNDELRVPCPLAEGGAIEAITHKRSHRLEGALGIVAHHLVEVAEPRGTQGLVLPGVIVRYPGTAASAMCRKCTKSPQSRSS